MTIEMSEGVQDWCMREWKVLELGGSGTFDCASWWKREPVHQVFTLTSPDGVLPEDLIEQLSSSDGESWVIDFSRLAPVEQDYDEHDDCEEFFVAWGTHGIDELQDVIEVQGRLRIVFTTIGFPADIWAQELAELFPQIETTFHYANTRWHGGFSSKGGEILNEVHELIV